MLSALCFFGLPAGFNAISYRLTESRADNFKDNTSRGNSLHFLDPDQHKLEIHVDLSLEESTYDSIPQLLILPGEFERFY